MKTNIKLITILSILILIIGSCIPSLHPLYTEEDLIFDPNIIGTWMTSDSTVWKFEKFIPKKIPGSKNIDQSDSKLYKLIVNDGKPAFFHVHLLKLGEYLYFDFYIREYKIENDMADMHLFPVHTFARVQADDNSIVLEHFNIEFIENLIKENKVKIKHEWSYDNLILTAGTKELQKFVIKYADDEDLYDDKPVMLKRKI